MLQITNYHQGAVLNHNHGIETDSELKIRIEGFTDMGFPVSVNGIPADMDGQRFSADIALTQKINQVTATSVTPYGNFSQELTLVWDKKSFKRYDFCLDDHIFTFTDLAKQRPAHAFDHFYLKWLKQLHRDYGLKITLNCFYHNDHEEFTLAQMPDIWKNEFIDNSDWLRFAFHAYSEFPDRPYAEASAEKFNADWDCVMQQLERIAGKAATISPTVIHWANVHPRVAQAAIQHGVQAYHRTFRLRVMGGPSLEDRQKGGDMKTVEKQSVSGEDIIASTEGLAQHYGFQEYTNYLMNNVVCYDPLLKVFFFNIIAVSNLLPLAEYPKAFADAIRNNEQKGIEVLSMGGHEQYSFPYYSNYEPDHLQRLEAAARLFAEAGYQATFFTNDLLGNSAWK